MANFNDWSKKQEGDTDTDKATHSTGDTTEEERQFRRDEEGD